MNVYDFSLFHNENVIAKIKIEENTANNITTCITEANRTFRNGEKSYNFTEPHDEALFKYFKIDGAKYFVRGKFRLSSRPWFIKYEQRPWKNEEIHRNLASKQIKVSDEDIVILSDIDEVLDRRSVPNLIELTKKHGIITAPLVVNNFYFNLICTNWGGPPRYSYRLFIMTGKKFNNLNKSSDELRKLGESGKLVNQIHCHEEYSGFHLSWIGDYEFVANKLKSYSHSACDHIEEIYNKDGSINDEALRVRLRKGLSIFPGQKLVIDNSISLLESVNSRRAELADFFI